MTPLDWQRRFVEVAIPDLLSVRAGELPPGMLAAVTGAGKTRAAAFLLSALLAQGHLPARVVVATSRVSLVEDIEAALVEELGRALVGVYYGRAKVSARIVVTTYVSLPALLAAGGCDLLICDEAHRTEAEEAKAAVCSIPWRMGMTATPYLGDDGRTISAFSRVFFRVTREEALAAGWIVPHHIEPLSPDEYAAVDLEGDPELRSLRAVFWKARALGGASVLGPGLITAPNLAAAKVAARVGAEFGFRCVAVGMDTPQKERTAAILGSRMGSVDVLVTVILLTEGADLPWLRWLGLSAWIGEAGRVLLAQVVGRGVRACPLARFPEQAHLGEKRRLIILDPAQVMLHRQLDHGESLGEAAARIVRLPRDPVARAAACIARLEDWPRAVATTEIERWSAAIRDHALEQAGREWASLPDAQILRGVARSFPASNDQWRIARRDFAAAGAAIQPPEQREMMGLLIERGRAQRGVVADLLIFLQWACGRARDQKRIKQAIFAGGRKPTGSDFAALKKVASLAARLPDGLMLPAQVEADGLPGVEAGK